MTGEGERDGHGVLERFESPAGAHAWCTAVRRSGASLGFVPTMGALHEGHLTLVRRAAAENVRVCVSVFVNPLQFDDPADLEAYPRDLDRDAALLAAAGCKMVFTGRLSDFFPGVAGPEAIPRRDPGPCALDLEGAGRAGHFEGVATIVGRLFELVGPGRAYFGAKDFQQTLVVRHVARELGYPEIVVCPTSRDADGLARSSRNVRLTPAARERALALSRALQAARRAFAEGERSVAVLEALLTRELARGDDGTPFEVEYAAVRDPELWGAGGDSAGPTARALVAARVGGVRLIDNLALDEALEGGASKGGA